MRIHFLLLSLCILAITGCCGLGKSSSADVSPTLGQFAIAIHGGAGTAPKSAGGAKVQIEALSAALEIGRKILAEGGSSLDAVQQVVIFLEDHPKFNAGRGAVYTHDFTHELDASIMNGKTLACGAVTGVRTIKNPINLARLVMEKSRHVLFAGDGAEKFADKMGVARVENSYFDTPERLESLKRKIEKEKMGKHGTVGAVALDQHGNLAAATSTGGLTNKRFGRVGDSPIIGAGTYANNRSCAVSGTGTGEEYIRHGVARDIAALMEYQGLSAQAAASEVVFNKLSEGDGGVIVVSRTGEIALVFNTPGMYRGAADSKGRFEVGVWKEEMSKP